MRNVAEKLAGKAAVVQVNTEENPTLAGRFAIREIPILYLLKNGRIIDQLAGAQTAETILAWFRQRT